MVQKPLFLVLLATALAIDAERATNSTMQITTVHLIAHTHDDVGWLKTVDQYYYGANRTITFGGVQYLLDSVFLDLQWDEDKYFTYVEMGYFERYWNEQSDQQKQLIKQLVAEGRFVFVNGGWSMHDEATPYFQDMIDNMALGNEFLLKTFNVKPTIGWQIDPFGHSEANTDMYAKMGFDAVFFWRINYLDEIKRKANREMEMIWKPQTGSGPVQGLFTHAFNGTYGWPMTFYFDIRRHGQPVMDDKNLFDYNQPERMNLMVEMLQAQAKNYRTSHIMFPCGGDFNYMISDMNFKNMDKLRLAINAEQEKFGLNLIWSTPYNYLNAVNQWDGNTTWPVKTDDFFPYADYTHSYWSGYFSSRAALKGYIRKTGSYLRAIQNMVGSLGVMKDVLEPKWVNATIGATEELQKAMGVTQHHDAVTGTERQHVADDYAKRLYKGQAALEPLANEIVSGVVLNATYESPVFLTQCPLLNLSSCGATESIGYTDIVEVVAYNPGLPQLDTVISLPFNVAGLTVVDDTNEQLTTDLVANAGENNDHDYDLYFKTSIPPFGFRAFKIYQNTTQTFSNYKNCASGDTCTIGNELYSIDLSMDGTMKTTRSGLGLDGSDTVEANLNIAMNYFVAHATPDASKATLDDNKYQDEYQASGAYVFRPDGSKSEYPITYATLSKISYYNGKTVDFAYLFYEGTPKNKVIQVIELPKGVGSHIKLRTFIDSIDISDGNGKEIILHLGTNWNGKGEFYTDSNGMGMVPRKWNYQPTYEVNTENEPAASNYYPVTSCISFNSSEPYETFAVVNDRAQAGTSRTVDEQSHIELMVQRRLLYDDDRGVGQPLNETVKYYGSVMGIKVIVDHTLILGEQDQLVQRTEEFKMNNPVQLFFGASGINYFAANNWPQFKGLSFKNFEVHFRLKMQDDGTLAYIARIRNMHSYYPQSFGIQDLVQSDLGQRFNWVEVSINENQPMAEAAKNRMTWTGENGVQIGPGYNDEQPNLEAQPEYAYVFHPGQVRSFLLTPNN